ncbi:MAG: tyrosine-type recombinase/integrase [Henriciella sp.]|nr:tyrosine-type recombinase/integrase [Henriciella sp.]
MDLNGLKNGPENLECRNGVYYLRMRVPKDVQEKFGRATIRESLGLKDRYKAKVELSRRLVAYNEQFEQYRTDRPTYQKVLTRRQAAEMASDWSMQQLQRVHMEPAETELLTGRNQTDIDAEMCHLADLLRELQLGGGEASNNEIEQCVHQLLLDNGFPELLPPAGQRIGPSFAQRADVDTATSQYAYLKRRVEEGLKSIWRAELAKHNGQTRVEAALNPIMPHPVSSEQIELGEMLRQFKAQKENENYGKRKLLAYNVVSEIMEEVFGASTRLDSITNQDCRRLIQVVRNIPPNARKRFGDVAYVAAAQLAVDQKLSTRSASTIQGDINAVNAVFNWAINQGMISQNPMPRRSFPRGHRPRPDEQRDAFSSEDLRAIFNAPVFKHPTRETRGTMRKTPARFWIPVLSLFHGCRLNELCQLYVQDIRTDADIPYLAIRGGSLGRADQRLKTQWSRRNIPIHPAVVDLGFLEFVRAMSDQKHVRLFPELRLCSRGYYSAQYQKWFTRLLEKTGAKRRRISFHSFRHSFRNAARRAELPTPTTCALGGWKLDGVHSHYGNFELPMLREAIERISFDLDISDLMTP